MRKIAFVALVLLVAVACNKKFEPSIKKGDHYVYASEDYKTADVTILGEATSEIDAVWFELYYENDHCKQEEPDRYALVVKRADGEIIKELGKFSSDWNSYITFTPDNAEGYTGAMSVDKEIITLTYELTDRTEEITFVYKDYK
ncbi:MAG: hypothetical protein DCO96_13440 [Fluviicola sp. XM-24bin1]|nr:MAG: hypothetical protein DCO96_13440 [Fluviicola sp. XM-24bin1]